MLPAPPGTAVTERRTWPLFGRLTRRRREARERDWAEQESFLAALRRAGTLSRNPR